MRSIITSWILVLFISISEVRSQINPPFYDGKACTSNSQCISNSCVGNICGEKLKITSLSKNGNQTVIETSYSETFGSPGTYGVEVDNTEIHMKGKIRVIYKIPSGDSQQIHKFTSLNFKLDVTSEAKGLGICLYQALEQKFEDNTVRCMVVGISDITSGSKVISTPSQDGERTNLALNKVATQSSNYNLGGVASKAVDGNTFAEYNYQDQDLNTVTHTQSEFNPWWRVDLGSQSIVRQIKIHKRIDGYNGRLFDFSVNGLNNNEAVVFTESWQTTPSQCSGTVITTSCSTDDIIYIIVPSTTAPIRHIKITLNGAVEPVLCLAEVFVYGISYDFQVPFGKFTNAPPTDVDRIVFFQDNAVGSAENTIRSIELQEGIDEPIYTALFLFVPEEKDLNIQGISTITRSNNQSYIALKDINNEKGIVVYFNSKILRFSDPFAAKSIALSDIGLMLVSFESSNQGFIRLLRIETNNISNKDEKVGILKFGSGLSITPDGSKAAVGSPLVGKVYIYDINPSTAEFESTVHVIEVPSSLASQYSGSEFGSKIALSESGNTIAIAAPKYKESGIEIGAVLLYTKLESGWTFLNNIVKGTSSSTKYGVAGLAIDDTIGRLDVTDFQGEVTNLKFEVTCNSMYAQSSGQNNNYFAPECRCFPGYKTYEGGRIILSPKDVCLPCANPKAPECNDEYAGPPGTQPTISPTISQAPTSWSENPSPAPTINKSPSASPSSNPSFSTGSQYDGDYCRFDNECFIGNCENDAPCDSAPPVSNTCYKCESTPFQFRANDADVTAIVESDNISIGGIIVSSVEPKQMDIYESAQKRMKLSSRVLTSSGTRVYVTFDPTDNPSTGLRICFFETAGVVNFGDNEPRCFNLSAPTDISFSLNSAFNGKTTYLQYIGVAQDSGHTKIKGIRFASEGGLKNPDGTCIDANAFLENGECFCKPGFVTANGNAQKQLKIVNGVVDVCVSCLDTLSCGFDGDRCLNDGDCYRDIRDSPCDSSSTCSGQNLQISGNVVGGITASLVERGISTETGGVVSYESELNIFGDTYKVFKMNDNLTVSRYTQFKFTARKGELFSTGLFQMCFFLQNETSFSEDLLSLSHAEKRCIEVGPLSTVFKSFVMNIGEDLFNYRKVDGVNYIGFKQSDSSDPRADSIIINGLVIDQSASIDFIDSNGRCVDENRESDLPVSGTCKCKSGYVNSNGGKFIISNDDKCVPCLEPCGFDGDSCTFITDCFSGVCGPANTCEAPPLVLDYEGDQYQDIYLKKGFGSSTRGNGIFVTQNAQGSQSIELEGDLFKVYEVTGYPMTMNKFTKIRFTSNKSPSTDLLKLCIYDSSSDFECAKYCHSVTEQGLQINEIFASQLFASRKVTISHIGFEQACSSCIQYERSSFSNLKIFEGTVTNSYNNGKCTDVNAVVVTRNNELVCKCSDGYIASNGGKILSNEDACIECVGGLACNAVDIGNDLKCFDELKLNLRLGGLQADPIVANARYLENFLMGFSGGGVEINTANSFTSDSVSLVGKMAKLFSLQVPYTVDNFSRLMLDFVPHDTEVDQIFVAICLQQLASSSKSARTQCYALEWEYLSGVSWNYVVNPLVKLNVALGKPTTQSSTDGSNVASNAVDGSTVFDQDNESSNNITSTDIEDFPYWEVDLEGQYNIDQVVIHFIPDSDVDILRDYNVLFIDRKNEISFNYYGDITKEDPVQTINVPLNVIAAKVRIVLNMIDDNARILSLVEVEIFQRMTRATKKIDIPLGNLIDGFVVDRIAFVQSGNNVNMVSNLSNINFVYGSAPEITDAPTVSPVPSISLKPSVSSSPTVLNTTAAQSAAQ